MRRTLFSLAALALVAASAGSCAEGEPRLGDDCTPNQRVFCRCPDGSGGTQLCARDGRSFGECGPCATTGGLGDGNVSRPSVCGNAIIEPGEACDDGNLEGGDDCTALCQRPSFGGPAPGEGVDDCAALAPAALNVGVEFEAGQALAAATGGARGTCGGDGADLVFALTPAIAGRLELTLAADPSLDAVLYVRRGDCADESPAAEAGCQNGAGAGGEERLSVAVEAATTYFLFVDALGAEPAAGAAAFTLRARLDPPQPCAGEGTACQTGLPGACAPGTLRCSDGQFLVCQPDQTTGDEVCGDGIDNDCDGDADEACPCAHDRCEEGAPLNGTCTAGGVPDACVAAICASDPFCCDASTDPPGRWDAGCVTRVYSVCGSLSCPAHSGTCAHPACAEGAVLAPACDGEVGCVAKVCDDDPFCCGLGTEPDQAWDDICVAKVANLCAVKAGTPVCPP
ncbi:MAG TPA: hypothetical protein VFS00_19815 [Polyangiaceae bacterium]|nr:hypothetical protein [Polyangiaceae bacterium]